MNGYLFKIARSAYCQKLQRVRHASALSSIHQTTAPVLVYRLTSDNPFINLSIENYIFRKAPPGTKILLFYVNRPCIVIGRNQNPWLEVNLHLLRTGVLDSVSQEKNLSNVDLVRRRSGGGTVFHDEGNVNWSVICDMNDFTRDKHAEMVVRGLRDLGLERARVNERHDIVLDQGDIKAPVDRDDTHATPYTEGARALKVSGSAYKVARGRALHHATALLNSKNLELIPQFLNSPAKHFITAKGVDSVRSPITNLNLSAVDFCKAVEIQFRKQYKTLPSDTSVVELGSGCMEIDEIRNDYEELTADKWLYLQTPQFTVRANSEINGELELDAKHGIIRHVKWSPPGTECMELDLSTRALELHKLDNWDAILSEISRKSAKSSPTFIREFAATLRNLLPRAL